MWWWAHSNVDRYHGEKWSVTQKKPEFALGDMTPNGVLIVSDAPVCKRKIFDLFKFFVDVSTL